jgi:hypothetical protein
VQQVPEYKRQIGTTTVVAQADASLKQEAMWLLGRIAEFADGGGKLDDDVKIRMGWSALTLRKRDARFVVCEPDFDGDPFTKTVEDVTRTLRVLFRQKDFVNRVSAKAQESMFGDKVVMAKNVLKTDSLALQRSEPKPGDSGWYVGPADDPESVTEYEAIYVYQLLHLRPALLDVLALPEGYVVFVTADTVDAVFDPDGVDVFGTKAKPAKK